MSEWRFGFQPNIWGDPDDPPYSPFFSRHEVIGDTTHIYIIHASDLDNIPADEWYDHLENIWQTYLEEYNK